MTFAGAPSGEATHRRVAVPPDRAGQRIDRVLADLIEDLSRSKVAALVREGHVRVDGERVLRTAYKVTGGEVVEIRVPPAEPSHLVAQDIDLDVVYEDDDLLVVNKPAGMVVHPAPGHRTGTLANALAGRWNLGVREPTAGGAPGLRPPGGDALRPGIVHRLDRGTSGLLVVARSERAFARLSEAMRARAIRRHYLAVVLGTKLDDEGTFDTLYGRHPRDRIRFSSRVRQGRRAVTHWQTVATGALATVVAVALETGRTHQIRVHFADAGHPVVGDPLYGRRLPGAARRSAWAAEWAAIERMSRPALHAAQLAFAHPSDGRPLVFSAPPPPDLAALIEAVGGDEALGAARALVSQPPPMDL